MPVQASPGHPAQLSPFPPPPPWPWEHHPKPDGADHPTMSTGVGDQKENVTQELFHSMRSSKPRRWLGSWRRWSRRVRSHLDSAREVCSSLLASTGASGPLTKSSWYFLAPTGCPGRTALALTAAARGELPVVLSRRVRRKKMNSRALPAGQWNRSAEEMLLHHARERAVIPPLSCHKLNRSQILLLAQSLHMIQVVMPFMPGGTGRTHLL